MMDDLRGQVADIIRDLPAETLNWRPPLPKGGDPMNSLAVLAVHIAGAEHFWAAEVIGKQAATRDRDAEFRFTASSAEEPLQRLKDVGEESRTILSILRDQDMDGTREVRGKDVPVRWGILHIIEHTSLHLGHMQLAYQMWAEGKSAPSPRWYERLPKS